MVTYLKAVPERPFVFSFSEWISVGTKIPFTALAFLTYWNSRNHEEGLPQVCFSLQSAVAWALFRLRLGRGGPGLARGEHTCGPDGEQQITGWGPVEGYFTQGKDGETAFNTFDGSTSLPVCLLLWRNKHEHITITKAPVSTSSILSVMKKEAEKDT